MKTQNSITILGTGTSTGVPQIGCNCEVCTSTDPRDKRLRASALVHYQGQDILIDAGPDFRQQMLTQGSPNLDALLITHIHYDHVGGIDDLRPYCKNGPFPIYCRADVFRDLKSHMPYSFSDHPYPGAPKYDVHIISELQPLHITDAEILPLPVMHGALPILGYKFGRMAYITDCKTMPHETLAQIRGLDLLVINALRHTPHPTHLSLQEALDIIAQAKPRHALLTHLCHQMAPHQQLSKTLPQGVEVAVDGHTYTW